MTDNYSQPQDRGTKTDDVADLPVQTTSDEQAEEVRGGKVAAQDFSFVKKVDKASPVLL